MLKLDAAPTFKRSVEIPLMDGQVAKIQCVFRWMHHREVAAFVRQAQVASTLGTRRARILQWLVRLIGWMPGLRAWSRRHRITHVTDFDYLDQVIESWEGVDLPWGREACERLVESYPHAVTILLGEWAKGLKDARSGN